MAPFGLISKSGGSNIPLKSIQIRSKVHGYTAEIVATIEHENNSNTPIEAIYVFPIDEEAAVCGFQATIDGRTIVAEVQEKQEARDTYDDAISSGHSAYLLEESDESSDVFQISVGNLAPYKSTTIEITFVTGLAVEKEGRVVFVLPTVLNPRYTPSDLLHSVSTTMPSIASVSTKYTFDFQLDVQCATAIQEITSPCNRIKVEINPEDNRQAKVQLDEEYKFNADVQVHVLSCKPFEPHALVENGVTKTKDGKEFNEFMSKPVVMLNFFPECDSFASLERGEFVFVIDRSGSMRGSKMKSARETLLLFLKSLPNSCYFNVIGFGSSFQKLFAKSEVYIDTTVDKACSYAQFMQADLGGTEILSPLQDVFSQPLIKGYPRQVFLLTDGEVGNTRQVVDLVSRNACNSRCFTFGIGEGASTALVKGVARAGRGSAEFVYSGDRLQPKVIKTLKNALQPAVKDVQVTWTLPKNWEVQNVPIRSPTIFAGNRLLSYGIFYRKDQNKYNSRQIVAIEGTATLTGRIDEGLNSSVIQHMIKFSAVCGNPGDRSVMLHRLCAKTSIQEKQNLIEGNIENISNNLKMPIIELSQYANIVSKFTSFVAVDQDSHEPVSTAMERPMVPKINQDGGGRVFALCSMSQGRLAPQSAASSMSNYSAYQPPPASSLTCYGVYPPPPPPPGSITCYDANPSQPPPPPPPGLMTSYSGYHSAPAPPPPPRESSKMAGRKALEQHFKPYKYSPTAPPTSIMYTSESLPLNKGHIDGHLALISLQKASGSWQLTEELACICDVTSNKLKNSCPSELTGDNRESVWATALALSCLFAKFKEKKDEWEMVAAKGTKWLKANLLLNNLSYAWIMDLALELLNV